MQIVEFSPGTLRFIEQIPAVAPTDGFLWIFIERDHLDTHWPALQRAAQSFGGAPVLDLHAQDLASQQHPSHYDYTSVYDLIVFRRLATPAEAQAEHPEVAPHRAALGAAGSASTASGLPALQRISTRAVGFLVFDRLLVSVHPSGCFTAQTFIQRYLSDALNSEGLTAALRSRLPTSPADLTLRMINVMVDSYLDMRKILTQRLERWQSELLDPGSRFRNWPALMSARNELILLEDLCEEQHDAMQEWLDSLREQPVVGLPPHERDGLLARLRDVIEHIERVVHHVRRLEQSAETVVQIHFSAQSNRTNDIMRVLTALTAIFLPLNFMTGFFGMNFEYLPLIHSQTALWTILLSMPVVALVIAGVFWRKRFLSHVDR